MNNLVFIVNRILSLVTVAGDILILLFIIFFLLKKLSLIKLLSRYSFHFALIVSLIATLGSLFYSEIAKFEPCRLCWYQRIIMYPQVILISLAIIKKDRHLADYLMALSAVGVLISSYHYYLQRGGQSIFPCSVVGYSASCSTRFIMEFGYITIPMMALTAFILIIILMVISKIKPSPRIIKSSRV